MVGPGDGGAGLVTGSLDGDGSAGLGSFGCGVLACCPFRVGERVGAFGVGLAVGCHAVPVVPPEMARTADWARGAETVPGPGSVRRARCQGWSVMAGRSPAFW